MMIASHAQAGGSSPFGGAVSTTDLVEWWPLSEASGTRVGVHAGLDLTDNNTVTGAAGNNGSSASQFTSANSEYLSRTSEAALQTGDIDFTFSLWIYPSDSTGFPVAIGKDNSTGARDYIVYQNALTATFAVFSGGVQKDAGKAGLTTGAWHFVVGWHDSAANMAYVDLNNSGSPGSIATGGTLDAATSAEFDIGRRQYSGSNLYYNGRIQRVGFWKRLLTAGEKTALFNSGNGLDY